MAVTINETISPQSSIDEFVPTFNDYCKTTYLRLSAISSAYNSIGKPLVDYYKTYAYEINESFLTFQNNAYNWFDFLLKTEALSGKLLQPFSIFYPILIQEPFNDDDVNKINNWIRKYYPIKNSDGSLNYVEGQKFYVYCYTYSNNEILNFTVSPYSYSTCLTQSGMITLHCQSLLTGGTVHCNQGNYECTGTIDCYPSMNVDCWYTAPYLTSSFSPITESNKSVMSSVSKIQADLTMQYTDREEMNIQVVVFDVENCDWTYIGTTIPNI